MKAIVWATLAFVTATGAVSQSSPWDRANPVNNGKPNEWRSHFEAVDKASGTAYRFTEITQLPDESEDRIYTLVEDTASHDRLVVKQRMNYMDHEASVEITDLDTHETASATSPLPYVSITRSGALDEIHKNPALRSWRVPSITLSVNGVAQTASETEWLSNVTRDRRSSVRKAASPQFLEKLERMRVVGASDSPLFHACGSVLTYLLYNERCRAQDVHTAVAFPDCAFDASFKFSCSEQSKQRIAKAKESGEMLDRY